MQKVKTLKICTDIRKSMQSNVLILIHFIKILVAKNAAFCQNSMLSLDVIPLPADVEDGSYEHFES